MKLLCRTELLWSSRVGDYQQAERRLSQAFHTIVDGMQSASHAAENAKLALQFVKLLEDTQPVNLSALAQWHQQLLKTRQIAPDAAMTPQAYLEVRML